LTTVDDDRVAVEDQIVLTADQVDVGYDRVGLDGAPGDQRQPHFVLVPFEGRAVDHDEQAGIGLQHPVDRAAVAPEVLADHQGDIGPADAQHEQFVPGNEDAVFVEHRVVGQMVLRVPGHDTPVLHHARHILGDGGRRVAGAQFARRVRSVRVPDDHRKRAETLVGQTRRERDRRRTGGAQEAGTGRQVLDRVPGQRHLTDREQIGSGGGSGTRGNQDLLGVAGEVSDRGVCLGQR